MASIIVGSKNSIPLQHSGHKEMWTQQHAGNFKKFLLVAEKQEMALVIDKW